MLFLLVARQIYPYVEPLNSEVLDGYEIEKLASGFGGPTCLEWADDVILLMCDRDSGRISRKSGIQTDRAIQDS